MTIFLSHEGPNHESTTIHNPRDEIFSSHQLVYFARHLKIRQDLDDCLWSPEMYTLHAKPSIPVKGDLYINPEREESEREIGIVGMGVPRGPTVQLFDGARKVRQMQSV